MGNQFIGFPVPRAKIADMIAGSAPPKIHHTEHENGGADEVDCTGLAGAGGISLPWDDLYYQTQFDSLDGYAVEKSAAGGAALNQYALLISVQATADSHCRLFREPYFMAPYQSWDKAQKLKTRVKFMAAGSNVGDFWVQSGGKNTVKHIGFKVSGGRLYGTVADGANESTRELENFGAGAINAIRLLSLVYDPGTECRFYVDGVDRGALTTDLPSGDATGGQFTFFEVNNPGVAEIKELWVGFWSIWQEV